MEQGDDSVLLFFTISKVKCQESFKEIEFWLVELATGRAVFFRERVVYALERKRENTTENDSSFFHSSSFYFFLTFVFIVLLLFLFLIRTGTITARMTR